MGEVLWTWNIFPSMYIYITFSTFNKNFVIITFQIAETNVPNVTWHATEQYNLKIKKLKIWNIETLKSRNNI